MQLSSSLTVSRFTRWLACLTGLLVSVLPLSAGAQPVREVYKVNAQYRGAVTKGFDNLGEIVVTYRPGDGTAFGIDMQAELRDPKKKKKRSQFEVSLRYRLDGAAVSSVEGKNQFNEQASKHREKILQNAPFIYLIRYRPVPTGGRSQVTYTVEGKPYRVQYAATRKNVEATVFEGKRWLGKFFIRRGDGGQPPNDFEKFRISTKNDTVISLVLDKRAAID